MTLLHNYFPKLTILTKTYGTILIQEFSWSDSSTDQVGQPGGFMSLLENTLSHDSFYQVNKKLVKKLGFEGAGILSHLLSQRKYLRSTNDLKSDGSFFCYSKYMEESFNLTKHKVTNIIKVLKEAGFISVKRYGIPFRNHYLINDDAIVKYLSQKEVKTDAKTKSAKSVYGIDLSLVDTTVDLESL